uniref:Uncharacterized protein n=1 Tax=Rhinopithecus roxellana TaxID=61622 RepID=A0A2K6Q754_RHIRO
APSWSLNHCFFFENRASCHFHMAFGVSPPTPLCSPATLMAQGKAGKPSQKHLWPREPLSLPLSQANCTNLRLCLFIIKVK